MSHNSPMTNEECIKIYGCTLEEYGKKVSSKNYNHVSHSHCYDQQSPPCGIKGHHCCLCDIVTIGKTPKEEKCHDCICECHKEDFICEKCAKGFPMPSSSHTWKEERTCHCGCRLLKKDCPNYLAVKSAKKSWENIERTLWQKECSEIDFYDNNNAVADYWIERMKAVREDTLRINFKETKEKARSAAFEEIKEMIERYVNEWKEPDFSFERYDALQSRKTQTFKKILSSLQELKGK